VKEGEAMLKVIRIASLMFLLSMAANAQSKDGPYVEFFNSYSYAVGGVGNGPGWLTSIAINRSHYVGFVGEFSRHYRTENLSTPDGVIKDTFGFKALLFGVQVYIKKQNTVSPFLRLMAGGSQENVIVTQDGKSSFAPRPAITLASGGGVDIRMREHFAFRLFQLDHLNFGHNRPGRFRLSTGLVVRF
jgi:hypothetical protein